MNLISLYTMGFLKLLFVLLFMHIQGEPLQLRTLDWSTYSEPGDLSIGGVFPIHRYDKKGKLCSETLLGTLQTQFVQAMVFGIQEINKRSDILPNITLGYVIMDDCTSENVALARAMSFITLAQVIKMQVGIQILVTMVTIIITVHRRKPRRQ